MNARSTQAPFPVARAASAMTLAAVGVGVITAVLVSSIAAWRSGASEVALAMLVTWLAALVSLVPVALMGPHGVSATITAYFAGMGARILVCAMAGVIAILGLNMATQPLLLGMVGMYLPLLLVEAALVGRYLTLKDAAATTAPGRAADEHKEALA